MTTKLSEDAGQEPVGQWSSAALNRILGRAENRLAHLPLFKPRYRLGFDQTAAVSLIGKSMLDFAIGQRLA